MPQRRTKHNDGADHADATEIPPDVQRDLQAQRKFAAMPLVDQLRVCANCFYNAVSNALDGGDGGERRLSRARCRIARLRQARGAANLGRSVERLTELVVEAVAKRPGARLDDVPAAKRILAPLRDWSLRGQRYADAVVSDCWTELERVRRRAEPPALRALQAGVRYGRTKLGNPVWPSERDRSDFQTGRDQAMHDLDCLEPFLSAPADAIADLIPLTELREIVPQSRVKRDAEHLGRFLTRRGVRLVKVAGKLHVERSVALRFFPKQAKYIEAYERPE